MYWVILITGIVGLAVAGYGFVALVRDAWPRRQYIDIAGAAAAVIVVVLLLVLYGDRLLR